MHVQCVALRMQCCMESILAPELAAWSQTWRTDGAHAGDQVGGVVQLAVPHARVRRGEQVAVHLRDPGFAALPNHQKCTMSEHVQLLASIVKIVQSGHAWHHLPSPRSNMVMPLHPSSDSRALL